MFRRRSVLSKVFFLTAACVLVFAIAADQFAELLFLIDNTSNDFTIRKERFATYALMLSAVIHHLIPLNSERSENDKWIRRSPTLEEGRASCADFLLLSALRR